MQPGTQLAQYRIIRRIGAGGMAEVFLAQQTGVAGFSRQVAIKTIIAAGASQESMGLFLDEARVASNLAHANIVQTLDLGLESDTLFIAMEYVPGPPLSRVIKELKDRGRLLPPHLVAYIGAKMANALDFAHRRVTTAQGQPLALVHRDISPQNILVSRSGIVKLMDFGVARASIQMHKTKTGQVRGKAAYMAPEQVRAQALDGRTDMFALGLVLYEMLTAYRPFQRNNEIASMRAIIGEDVPPLADRNPDVPPELAAAVMRCLRRPPDERYAHCGELEDALLRTIRTHRGSALEHELVSVLEELFGTEQFSDELPEVEAWQPTMANMDAPDTPKLPKLPWTPEMVALIHQTPQTPQAAPMHEPVGEPAPPRGYTQPPQRTPPPAAFTQPPQRTPPPATPEHLDAGLTPDALSPQRSLTPGSLAAGNLRLTVSSNGQMHGLLSSTNNGLSPYSLPSMTPASSPSITTTVGGNGHLKLVIAVLASFLAGILLMVVLRDGEPARPAPSAPEVSPEAPRAITPPSTPTPTPAATAAATPAPSASPPATVGEAPPPGPSRLPQPTRSPRGRTPEAHAAASPVASPDPSPTAAPALDKAQLGRQAMTLKSRAEASGNTELAKKLGELFQDLALGRDPTPADAELVRAAERALR